MFTSEPTKTTLSHAIVTYRLMLQKVIATADNIDPKFIFQTFLREYIATEPDNFFAARLIPLLNQPQANVLILLNDYFAGACLNKQSSFFAALTAYLYYFADYYQTDCGLYSENQYPELMRQLILPLRLYQAQISQTFKAKLVFWTTDLDTNAAYFLQQLNNIIACDTPFECRKQVYQNLLAKLRHKQSTIAEIMSFLCQLGIADEDKDFLLAAYIEKYSHTYLTIEKISFLFLNDADAINHLLKLSLHEKINIRDTVSGCLNALYHKATLAQQIAIVQFWLKETDQRLHNTVYISWQRLLNCKLPENMIDIVYSKLMACFRGCQPSKYNQLLSLTYHFSATDDQNWFDDEHYQGIVDTLMIEPIDKIALTNINPKKLSSQQINKLIPFYIDELTNANNYSALLGLYNLPVTMEYWKIMVHKHFTFLQLNYLNSNWKMPSNPRADDQILYASQYFLNKLSSNDTNEVEAACAGIHYFQHPTLKDSIITHLLELLNSPNEHVQLAAVKSLRYVKPHLYIDRFTDRLIQLMRADRESFEICLSLQAISTEATQKQIIALFEELAFGPTHDANAMLRLIDMQAPLNKNLIPKMFSREIYVRYNHFDAGINNIVIPNELVAEVVKHVLLLITEDGNLPCNHVGKACELLLKLPPIYPSEMVVIGIIDKLNRSSIYELSGLAKLLLNLLNKLDIPLNHSIPVAKSMISLMNELLVDDGTYLKEWSHCYNLIQGILSKVMQQSSCAERCHILALLDSPDLSNIPLLSYLERLKATFITPLLLKEEVRRKSELPYLPAEMWQQIRP